MEAELYYTPPSDEIFNEVKQASINIWKTYSDEFGYQSEKINSIKDIPNVGDNFMYMVAMFDFTNQMKLRWSISKEAKDAIADRLTDGGTPDEYNIFKL